MIGIFSSTTPAVLPAKTTDLVFVTETNSRPLPKCSYQQMIELDSKCKQELVWWIRSSRLSNGKCLMQLPQQVIIQEDL